MVRQVYQCSNSMCSRQVHEFIQVQKQIITYLTLQYTALEAQRLIEPGQHEFLCGHCNEALKELNNNEALEAVQLLQKKVKTTRKNHMIQQLINDNDDGIQFKIQMNRQEGLHDGITELLSKIGKWVAEGNHLPSYVILPPSTNNCST